MKQKTFSIVFALLMSMVSNVALAYDVEIDGIYYNLNATYKTATVTEGSGYSGDVVIPQIVNYNNQTYTVTRIGSHAFYSRSSMTSITIPNSVTSIGLYAFSYCSSLTSITIPSSVTSIGDYAFYDCTSLTSITVDSGNTIFDSRGNCNAIIETASNTLLFGCMNTTIPSSVTSIGEWAFYDCTSLTSITIPNSVTSIGQWAFEFCSSLTSITIPSSVTSIGKGAFEFCSSLTSITIPSSVTSIGEGAFCNCTGLTSMTVDSGNTIFDSRDNCNAIIETASNTLIFGCMNTTIPSSVTSIGERAFSGCSSLTSITIPSSVTSIGIGAFRNCTSLTSMTVDSGNTIFDSRGNCNAIIETASNTILFGCMNTTIPSSVTSIGEWAFYDCTSLTSITIPNSVTCIGNSAFSGCAGLTRITIPSSVTSIGNCAFSGCANLTSVISLIENPFPIDASVFYPTVYLQARLYVILGKKDVYAQTDGWNEFLNTKEIDPSGIGTVSRNGATPKEYYSLGGERMNGQQKGLNIIRMSDGTVRKVLSR